MKQIFLDIQTALQNNPPVYALPSGVTLDANGCVFLYNHQLEDLEKGERPEFPQVSFFVEFINPIVYKQGGNGVQFAYFKTRIYIVHHFYLATDGLDGGQGDQDLTIFDLKQWVYITLQQFSPTNTGEMVRTSEAVDYSHDNANVYAMEFDCVFEDIAADAPIGGIPMTPAPTLNPTMTIQD